MKIGVIDIGSNSIKMIIVNTNKGLVIEKNLKDYVLLNEKCNDMLTEDKMNEAITTLTKFAHECMDTDKVIVVATQAVRSAKNQQIFVERVKQVTGLEIRVLKGEEEAYYDYFATVKSMNVSDHDLLIDVGGGSTELILINQGKIGDSISLPFGVVTLTDKFKLHDKETKGQEGDLKKYIGGYIDKLDWLKKAKGHNIVGMGGSITNIGSVHLKENNKSLELLHAYSIPVEEFKDIYFKLKHETDAVRLQEKGIIKEEVDFVIASADVVNILIEKLEIKNIVFSKNGIREGLVYKEIEG